MDTKPTSLLSFLNDWFSQAIRGKLGLSVFASGLAAAIAIIYLLVASNTNLPSFEEQTLNWIIGGAFSIVFLGALAIDLVRAPFDLFRAEEEKRQKAEKDMRDEWEKRQEISVNHVVVNRRAILEIRNDGAEGAFTAKARVISKGLREPEWYTMYWESESHNKSIRIDENGLQSILVGTIASRTTLSHDPAENLYEGGLAMYLLGGEGEQQFPGQTTVIDELGPGRTEHCMAEKCEIEVMITSSPAMKEPFEETYEVEIINGRVGLIFQPTSYPPGVE